MNFNAIGPPRLDALFDAAVALHLRGETIKAATTYRAVLKADPRHFGALRNLGLMRLADGLHGEAIVLFRQALGVEPTSIETRRDMARAYVAAGDLGAALAANGECLKLAPDDAMLHTERADLLVSIGRRSEAIDHYRRAIALKPGVAAVHNNLGVALREQYLLSEALGAFSRAVALDPALAASQSNLGGMLVEKGDIAGGISAYQAAVKLEPSCGLFHYHLAEAKTFTAGDPDLARMIALAPTCETLPLADRVPFKFAIAKALADVGAHEGAFSHLIEANRLKRESVTYNESETLAALHATAAEYTSEALQKLAADGTPSQVPVFVVGMPRSGSTLVAQVLSNHAAVHGAGELDFFRDLVTELPGAKLAGGMPTVFPATLEGSDVTSVGGHYIDQLVRLASDADRIIDKMPHNFQYLGLINAALPQARVIHVRRDPLDTCISCFFKLFTGPHDYAYDLGELGRYYRAYDSLMAHWRRVLPPGMMLEVQYEDIVADLEGQAKRMVEHCGLSWDPACLQFEKNRRWVRTASATQVRQSLYKSAVGRWRRYESRLAQLFDALGLNAPDDAA